MDLDKFINFSVISNGLILLAMSFGFLPGSYVVIFLMFLGMFILNTMSISRLSKEYFQELMDENSVDYFMSTGPIFGPIGLFLFWVLIVTFNLFVWPLFFVFLHGKYYVANIK
jgi:hypothetical protein